MIYVDVISNKQSIFSSQICTPSFPINWRSLVSTARSPIILWRLWSYKPSHKQDSNKHQSKAFVICDHKSAPRQSEAAFVGERSFSKSWGLRASGSFIPLPLPRPFFFFFFFFCSRPNFLHELARKRSLHRLYPPSLWKVVPPAAKLWNSVIYARYTQGRYTQGRLAALL